jgi:uncharacterized protein YaeQ
MASPSTGPLQLRISLAHVDRGVERIAKLILARDPEVTPPALMLRVLAYCLFFEEGLRVSDAPSRRDRADLQVVRLDGKTALWIACGAADADEIRRLYTHNRGVAVHALFDDAAARDHFLRHIETIKKRPPGFDDMSIWTVDGAAVARLAARQELRQRWAVTVVADHLYVDSDGLAVDTAVTRQPAPPFVP